MIICILFGFSLTSKVLLAQNNTSTKTVPLPRATTEPPLPVTQLPGPVSPPTPTALLTTTPAEFALPGDPITVTCTVSSDQEIQGETVTWFHGSDIILERLLDNSTLGVEEVVVRADVEKQEESFSCQIDGDSSSVRSDGVFVPVRDLLIRQIPESAPLYRYQEAKLEILEYGDSIQLNCDPRKEITVTKSTLKRKLHLNYKAEKSRNVTCIALYNGPTEDAPYEIEKQILVQVLAPAWTEWSMFSEQCEIRPDAIYSCAKVKNRTCVNHSKYSSCDGDRLEVQLCEPDVCEPYVTPWGGWGTCHLSPNSTCRKSRHRYCTFANNSTRTCTEELVSSEPCDPITCDRWDDWNGWSRCRRLSHVDNTCARTRNRECELDSVGCLGPHEETSICEKLNCAPEFQTYGRKEVRRAYKQDLYLFCDVEPSPTVGYYGMEVQWKMNSAVIRGFTPATIESLKYYVEHLTETGRGRYACCVRNEYGLNCNEKWDVQLLDYGPVPTRPMEQVEPVVLPTGSNYTLKCQLEGYSLDYEWYKRQEGQSKDKQIELMESSRWLRIGGMSKGQQGIYSCCASDKLVSRKFLCSEGYSITQPANTQRRYLIITIVTILLLLFGLLLYITCVHTSRMNGLKRRFRSMFGTGHSKLYNGGYDPYGSGQQIQRSQSYMIRLSKSRPLSKTDLSAMIQRLSETTETEIPDHELGMEFDSVPSNTITINKTPVGTESKNRYLNVLPNPHSRVLLPEVARDPVSTYVNANYVRGYKLVPKEYIATQGPLPSTCNDFWRLVWNEESRIIVMTTGLIESNRMKCSLYWPAAETGVPLRQGDFIVTQLGTYPSRFYSLSILNVKKLEESDSDSSRSRNSSNNSKSSEGCTSGPRKGSNCDSGRGADAASHKSNEGSGDGSRTIYHLWYHAWPDFGVPEDTGPFLDFVKCVRAFKVSLEMWPVLVHCSAGIGRTGTFIAVNLGIEQFHDTGKVDPLGYICQLRQDRGGMIQTLDQYMFVYRALHAFQIRALISEFDNSIEYGISGISAPLKQLLPTGLRLPVVRNIEGSSVGPEFVAHITATIRTASRYSEAGSIQCDETRESTESLNTSHQPLLDKKEKRKNKVKSLFLPSPRDNRPSSQQSDLEPSHRSLSLSNVTYSKSRDCVNLSQNQPSGQSPGSSPAPRDSPLRDRTDSRHSGKSDCSVQIEPAD